MWGLLQLIQEKIDNYYVIVYSLRAKCNVKFRLVNMVLVFKFFTCSHFFVWVMFYMLFISSLDRHSTRQWAI